MDGLFRRGGVWCARLVIPAQLRAAIGKTAFIANTGVREPALARVVAAELLAGWRRWLLDLGRLTSGCMDIERVCYGHPSLSGGGYLPILEAEAASGIDLRSLLRRAADGKLGL